MAACSQGQSTAGDGVVRPLEEVTPTPAVQVTVQFVGAEPLSDERRSTLAEMIERIQGGVVQVVSGGGSGSGFVVSPDGLVSLTTTS